MRCLSTLLFLASLSVSAQEAPGTKEDLSAYETRAPEPLPTCKKLVSYVSSTGNLYTCAYELVQGKCVTSGKVDWMSCTSPKAPSDIPSHRVVCSEGTLHDYHVYWKEAEGSPLVYCPIKDPKLCAERQKSDELCVDYDACSLHPPTSDESCYRKPAPQPVKDPTKPIIKT